MAAELTELKLSTKKDIEWNRFCVKVNIAENQIRSFRFFFKQSRGNLMKI